MRDASMLFCPLVATMAVNSVPTAVIAGQQPTVPSVEAVGAGRKRGGPRSRAARLQRVATVSLNGLLSATLTEVRGVLVSEAR